MKSILVNFDDVVFESSYGMYTMILAHWRIFSRWFVGLPRMSVSEFHKREFENVNEYLIKPEIALMDQKQYALSQATIMQEMRDRYDDVLLFSPVSEFFSERFLNPAFLQSDAVDSIYIYSKYIDAEMLRKKKEKIEKTFKDPKIHFLPIPKNSNLYEVCNKNKIGWKMLVTPNIYEIADMFRDPISKREFLVPHYKYVEIPSNLSDLVLRNECAIRYYDPK